MNVPHAAKIPNKGQRPKTGPTSIPVPIMARAKLPVDSSIPFTHSPFVEELTDNQTTGLHGCAFRHSQYEAGRYVTLLRRVAGRRRTSCPAATRESHKRLSDMGVGTVSNAYN